MNAKLLVAVLPALAALAAAGSASPRSAARPLRTQVLAHVNPGGGYSADVVAHRGFAYLSSWHGQQCPSLGVRVYDLKMPTRPVRVATFADVASEPEVRGSWTEKTIVRRVHTADFSGDLAVTTFQRCATGGLQGFGLYDVTNPAAPRRLAIVRTNPRGSHEIWLATARGKAWVYTAIPSSELLSSPGYDPDRKPRGTTPGEPDFRIFDVSNPSQPVQVGGWGAWRSLGINPRDGRGGFSSNFVHSVITNPAATRAYLSYWDLGTVILDISNPASPRYLGRTPAVDAEGDAHSSWLMKSGKVLVETHENAIGRPFFFDISNPRKPQLLSRFGPSGGGNSFTAGVHDPKIVGNRGYFSWYSRGVLVGNVANPRKPKLIARFTPARSQDPERSFCPGSSCSLIWGVFPTAKYVLASDIVGGLWVFRLR